MSLAKSWAWPKMSFTTVGTWLFCSLQLISKPLGNLWVTFLSMGARSLHEAERECWMRFTHKSWDFTSWTFKKIHQISQYPQSDCEGWWPFGCERIFFQYCLRWLLLPIFSFLLHETLFFRVLYKLCILYIGKSSFSRHTALLCFFFCSFFKEQDSFLCSPLSHHFLYSLGGLLKAALYSLYLL